MEYDISDIRSHHDEIEVKGNQSCFLHNMNKHSMENRKTYQGKTYEERMNIIKGENACWSCLRVGHRMTECWNKRQCGVNDCDRNYHASLHNASVSGHTYHSSLYYDCIISSSYCMLPIMVIKASLSENFMNVLFDGGSTISLITFRQLADLV